MLKRTRNNSEDIIEEVSTGVGLSGKFSGIGTKMEKIFRAAFRKDLSQSTQELNADVDDNLQQIEDKSDSKDINNRKKLVRGKMKRTKALGSSDWSSDVDFGSKKNLVEGNKITGDEMHEIIDKIDSNSKNNIKKSGKKLRKLKRSERIRSNELESNSDIVVVDIHRENISKSPKKIEQTIIDITEHEDHEIEQEIINNSNSNQKSLDITQDNLVDSMKRQRKRWSKDANIVIPRKESTSSSSVSDKSNSWVKKSGTTAATKPVPAPRLNKIIIEESSSRDHKKLGQDNEAFESDHDYVEQVLTIETEFGVVKKTKIEMNSADSEGEEIEEIEEIEAEQVIKSVERLADISDIEEINQETVVQKIKISDRERDSESQTKNSSSSSRENEKHAKHSRQKNQSAEDSTSSDIQKISEVATAIKEDKKYKKKIRERCKSKSKSKSSSSRSQSGTVSSQSVDIKPPHRKNRKTRKKEDVEHDFKFISITIHRADMLTADYMTKHPMVIVHIVEESTGNYLKTGKESKNHLQPLITGTFDFRENKSMIPCWEEELIFEHDFDSIVNHDNHKTLILFEIVDLPTFADASYTYDHFGSIIKIIKR